MDRKKTPLFLRHPSRLPGCHPNPCKEISSTAFAGLPSP
jgi:hypothetical protein